MGGGGVAMKQKKEEERKWSEIRRMQLRERNQRQRGEREENGIQVIPESKYDLSCTIFSVVLTRGSWSWIGLGQVEKGERFEKKLTQGFWVSFH